MTDKLGICWYQLYINYHHQYDTSIAMVSLQYSADSFVSIWYHHAPNSSDFHKNFDAYHNLAWLTR